MSIHITQKIKEIELEKHTKFTEALFLLQDIISSDTISSDNNKVIIAMNDFSEKMKSIDCCKEYSQDAIFILLYSSILIYNDLFNIKIKKKITFNQFIKMLKGCNSEKDFPEDLLISIYNEIKEKNKNITIENIDKNKNMKNNWCMIL